MPTARTSRPRRAALGRALQALAACLLTLALGTAPTHARPVGPLIYLATDKNAPPPPENLWDIARPMAWIPDHQVLDPHGDWRRATLPHMRKHGVMHLPSGPILYNKERGTTADQIQALKTLRRLYPDRRIGVFYTAAESIYREAAWRADDDARLLEAQWAWRDTHLGAEDQPGPGLEHHCDYTTVYGYRLTPDRDAHRRGVLAGLEMAARATPKPTYLVTWTHIHPEADQMGERAGERQPLEEWLWEIQEIWPLFDGVIIFAPYGIDEQLTNTLVEASTAWAPAWIRGDYAPVNPR